MSALVVVGAQWGDEGKGKVVDLLTADADLVVRFGGGANAGHTLVVGGEKVVFHLVPSAALHPRPRCLLGPGMVIDPKVLVRELEVLRARGLLPAGRMVVSENAHLVLPQHFLVDGLREAGPGAIGTTKRGIGPCYQDRAARRGLRAIDLAHPAELREKLAANLEAWRPFVEAAGAELPDAAAVADEYLALGEAIVPWIGDVTEAVYAAHRAGHRIVLEGAQGTMLDIDHGTFPYVTSSSVTAGGACTGSGLGPTAIDHVVGIAKAYTTRVGEGPLPTELHGDEGEALRRAGGEYGATTGRPRRCGWLDLPVLRHAVRVNGLSSLALTKLDVLSGRETLEVCVAYELDGARRDTPPARGLERVTPIYERVPGWTEDVSGARSLGDLPPAARAYVARIEEALEIPVSILGVGADRDATIVLSDPWA
ncbi:MAG: adenylosuccinate synthase [Sandaracinaceae bacterium]|nr:adenylosuccinate synthase [Sandaracinaceae bacterium]